MLFDIPNELIPYVRISKKQGLIKSDEMPNDLLPLFEKTKEQYKLQEEDRINNLKKMLVDPSNK